ncbi:hypothetical protein ES319_D01G153700v1 [Gossypium barbadense]|uniref:Uncharacterized protein n=1 Tax=Gossypium barbadense TaxID=3634 RepID=A0A5J5SP54_GOSBA|nr:hypothetical protein ES319_D01G153700v1 [Gossypium barbadense]
MADTHKTIQLIKLHNDDCIHTILHFSTNLICFVILSGYSILGNEELLSLNSCVQEFLYNLSNTIKSISILLLTDLCIGFHFPHVILDTIFKYWIFRYLNSKQWILCNPIITVGLLNCN